MKKRIKNFLADLRFCREYGYPLPLVLMAFQHLNLFRNYDYLKEDKK